MGSKEPGPVTLPPRVVQLFLSVKEECRQRHIRTEPLDTDGLYCNRTMDSFGGCWDDTPAGQKAVIRCPRIPMLFNQNAYATKECTSNGTWYVNQTTGQEWANYTDCFSVEKVEDHTKYIYIFIGGFAISLVLLIISLVIFFWFRQLRCDRITIHKNLFISYVFTGVTWILYYVLVALNGQVQLDNPLWCKVLQVIPQYFTVCNFFWMFCEGLYLNTIMVYAFNSGKVLIISCYIIGWGIPVILTCIYVVIRANAKDMYETNDCWINESSLLWIMYGPVVVSIAINVIFLINIVRLLVTKLRQMPEATQTRKATRATLILVPLLGLQYLLFYRPPAGSVLEEIYHIVVALVVSLQGAFVAVIYCFCNGEVISLMRRKWNQHQLMKGNSFRSTAHGGATTYTTIDHVNPTNASCYSSINSKDPAIELKKTEQP